MRRIDQIVIHHTAGPPDQTVEQIRRFHIDERGWDDIGYHFVITDDGRVHKGRDWQRIPACVQNKNTHSLCIAVTGDNTDPDNEWNDLQFTALRATIDTLVAITGADVGGHKDYRDTLCPGLEVSDYYQPIG